MKYGHRDKLLSKFPCPRKLPIIHNTLEFYNASIVDIFKWVEKQRKELGNIYYMSVHPFDSSDFIVADVKIAEAILSSQKLIDKGADYDLMKPWLGTGLLISSGKKWHQRRKVITPAFHFSILEKYVEIFETQGNIFVEKLKKYENKLVDIFPLAGLYALDVICESAMGCKINAQENESEYLSSVKKTSEIIFDRAFGTFTRLDFIFRFTENFKIYEKCLEILHDFTNNVIRTRQSELMNNIKIDSEDNNNYIGIKKREAFLDVLLKASIDGKSLTNADIREEVDTFMFEGHDTTTSGISFCIYNIAKYPEIQQKIYSEILEKIEEGEKLTLNVLSRLNYLELVIKESLRLFPSVPFFARRLNDDDVKIGNHVFPRYSSINISPYLMGRDENLFENPLEFIPERFDVETTAEKVNPYAYIPFSAGPRNCIGQKFAMNEIKSILCKLVKTYEFMLPANAEPLEIYAELILKSANGVKIIPKLRCSMKNER